MTSHPSHLGTWTLPTGGICDIYYSPEMIDVFLKINKIAPSTSILDIRIEWKGRRPDFRSPGVMQHWKAVVIPEV